MSRLATALAAVALTTALAACDKAPAPAADNSAAAGANTGAPTIAATDDANATTGEMPATITARYDCMPAMAISVVYDNKDAANPRAQVTINGAGYDMAIARSASGARYKTDKGRSPGKTLVWWNKGNDATLLEGKAGAPDTADETVIATCSGRG